MTRTLVMLSFSVSFSFGRLHAATVVADSARGAELFDTLSCVQCHSINGKGGTVAPDLGRRIDRNFTPASLAATMWNHAPAMWASMRARTIRTADLSEQAAADLFVYFYSARFFEKPGDAGRGKRLFSSKHCSECHDLTGAKLPEATPVNQWQSIGQPMALVNALWNHAATMRQEFAKKKLNWPDLTAQDLTDILVYVRNLPSALNAATRVEITSGANGQALFDSKGCAACHSGSAALESRIKGKTLTDIAVEMWNHEPKMPSSPAPLELGEMRDITSYLWAAQFFQDQGNPAAGGRVFMAKSCAICHNDPASGAPKLAGTGRSFTAASMVSTLWHHGPQMLDQMKAKGIGWPRFDGPEMANLVAYLNAQNAEK
ncbi:MAG: c-type cytochrome [Acidobacteriia bacterium]|nr:c-type cytochrome [Terriglobia bacterium]